MSDPIGLLLDIASWFLLAGGGLICLIGAVGMHRMPDLYTRMHASSVVDGLGAGMILIGTVLQAGFTLTGLKLVILEALLLFTSPLAAHALARGALHRGVRPRLGHEDAAARAALGRVLGQAPTLAPEDRPGAARAED